MQEAGMKVAKTVVLALVVALAAPVLGWTAETCTSKPGVQEPSTNPGNADLELAERYAGLGDWKDAETHFAAAAKDPASRVEALACIEMARRNEDAAVLETGKHYESEHLWSRAEDLYRTAATDPSLAEETRKKAASRLSALLQAQTWDQEWTEWKEKVKDPTEAIVGVVVEVGAFLLALVILVATILSIAKSRRIILIHPFAAPTDELAKGLNIHLKYARTMMQNPALSPAGQMPAALVGNLLTFDDEIEPIEDLEIAGSKIPFASLAKLFGRPAIRVSGGFDGVAPFGYAYSVVKTHDGRADALLQHTIRVGVPSLQRRDLLDFAYDVMVSASSANANL
jgi:hypothetical protein